MTSKRAKDAMIAQYVEFTSATVPDATRLLKAHNWNLSVAMDAFYSDPQALRNAEKAAQASTPNLVPRLTTLFEKYAGGKGKETIPMDGTIAWCSDLGVEPEDPVMLAVAELCKASEMGVFEKKGWIDGWAKQKKDSIEGQKEALKQLRQSMTGKVEDFKRIYEFAFAWVKPAEQRSMPLEMAGPMWQMLLPQAPPALFQSQSAWNPHADPEQATESLDRWIKYLTEDNKARPVSKDTWSQFLDFAAMMDTSYSAFDPEEAWPSVIDAFVEHEKENSATKMQE